MPWNESRAMDERMRFIVAATEEGAVMSQVCEAFGISRTIGYKWVHRYLSEGPEGLKDRSRAPHAHGRASAEETVATALALRERYRHWGPRKLRVKLGELPCLGCQCGGSSSASRRNGSSRANRSRTAGMNGCIGR